MRDCCAVMMLSSSSMLGLPSFHRSFRDWMATSSVPSSFKSSVCCSAPAYEAWERSIQGISSNQPCS